MKYSWLIVLLFGFNLSHAQVNNDKVRMTVENDQTIFYSYNDKGYLATQKNSKFSYYYSYVYLKDSVLQYKVDLIDSVLQKIYVLNKNGLAYKITTLEDGIMYDEFYQYENKQLKKKYYTHDKTTQVVLYEYQNGNKIKEYKYDTFWSNDKMIYENTTTLYLYMDKPNSLTNSNYGQPYLSISSANLLKTKIIIDYASNMYGDLEIPQYDINNPMLEANFNYTYDEKGRLKELIRTDKVPQNKDVIKYYYY
ncbi:MAG: hypothetical protein U0U67_15445 [Chitinophagales bacterium]